MSYCAAVIRSYRHTVLESHCLTVNCATFSLFYRHTVLQSYCPTISPSYCAMGSHRHTVPMYLLNVILSYGHTVPLSYVILSYCPTGTYSPTVQSHCLTVLVVYIDSNAYTVLLSHWLTVILSSCVTVPLTILLSYCPIILLWHWLTVILCRTFSLSYWHTVMVMS